MTRLIGAEVLKLRTTRTFYGLTLGALGLIVLITAIAAIAGDFKNEHQPGVDLLGIGGVTQLFTLVLGLLAVSTEFRHGTITPSLLVTPDRARLVVAKLVAHLGAGLVIGVLGFVVCAVLTLGILGARDVDTGTDGAKVVEIVAGGSVAAALFAALGVGIGALVRNQVGAIVGSLAYMFVAEPLLGIVPGIDDAVAKFGLSGVSDALTAATTDPGDDVLHQLPAGLVFSGYALAFVAAGIFVMRRRDVAS